MENDRELQCNPKLRMNAHDRDQIWPRRVECLLAWQAACSLPHLSTTAATDHMGNAEVKQEMLLHKIGAFWDGPGWTGPGAPFVWRASFGAALPRDGCAPRGRFSFKCSVADAVHELVARVAAAHRFRRFRLVWELLGLVAALEEAR